MALRSKDVNAEDSLLPEERHNRNGISFLTKITTLNSMRSIAKYSQLATTSPSNSSSLLITRMIFGKNYSPIK
jgi:hypothetical protein